jgi:outer membrane protein assembly factor BamB
MKATHERPWRLPARAAALALAFTGLNGRSVAQEKAVRPAQGPVLADVAGTWVASLSHAGETQPFALRFEANDKGELVVKMTAPAVHVWEVPIGTAALEPGRVRIGGGFVLDYDHAAGTLSGTIPSVLIPVYDIAAVFHRGALERTPRPDPTAPVVKPVWTFDAGAPVWADALFDAGTLYVGADDGRLHALEAKTGKERWSFRAGGPIRALPTRSAGDLFFQADDGFLYRIDATSGAERSKVRVNEKAIERLPPSNEKSRFDRVASGATLANGRLFVGTHDGHVLALDPAGGSRLWDFAAGDTVLSTPVVDSGRVYFGSYDGNVYAVDAASGSLVWKHDTGKPVVSTPALHEGRVIVGSRSYDLLALDGVSGAPAWTRYIWFSWIESSATVRDGTAYLGSSDAAKVFAIDARTGKSVWELDARGWAWGQPAVTDTRVFLGTTATPHYLVGHESAFLAIDRATGRLAWRHPLAAPAADETYGFPSSPAVGDGLVFAGALDGRVYAFAQ